MIKNQALIKTSILHSLLTFILFTNISAQTTSQQISPTSAAPSAWVSIANEYIGISMETNTGRFLVFDTETSYTFDEASVSNPVFLQQTAPLPESFNNLPSILGSKKNSLNFTTLKIDGESIVFGSSRGNWVAPPIIRPNSIMYTWQIGDIQIIQTLSLTTNIDTLYVDALSVSYDIINTAPDRFYRIGTRISLDPTINDSSEVPFFIVDNKPIFSEFQSFLSDLPEYWLTSDVSGGLSTSSLKGYLKGLNITPPDSFYLTTLGKATADPWDFKYNAETRLNNNNVAILLYYDSKRIAPQSSVRLASFQVSRPALLETFQSNGLEGKVSSFSSKETTPLSVSAWVRNTSKEVFDDVELSLQAPNWIQILDSQVKNVYNLDSSFTPVSWRVTTKERTGRVANMKIKVVGKRNGVIVSLFEIPISVNIDPTYKKNNDKALKKTIDKAVDSIVSAPPLDTVNPRNSTLGRTQGSSSSTGTVPRRSGGGIRGIEGYRGGTTETNRGSSQRNVPTERVPEQRGPGVIEIEPRSSRNNSNINSGDFSYQEQGSRPNTSRGAPSNTTGSSSQNSPNNRNSSSISNPLNAVTLDSFSEADTYGTTSENLEEIYNKLKSVNSVDTQQIIKLIETEIQLLKEIQHAEQGIKELNIQYEILLQVYKNLYQNPTLSPINQEYVNIQEFSDNIDVLEKRLKDQQFIFNEYIQDSNN